MFDITKEPKLQFSVRGVFGLTAVVAALMAIRVAFPRVFVGALIVTIGFAGTAALLFALRFERNDEVVQTILAVAATLVIALTILRFMT